MGAGAIHTKPRILTCYCSRIGPINIDVAGKSLTEIDFTGTGYRRQLSESSTYGVVWSRHIHLLPKAEVELTSAECSWARTDPVERASNGDILRVGRSTGASGSCCTRRLGICGSVECLRPSRTAVISV